MALSGSAQAANPTPATAVLMMPLRPLGIDPAVAARLEDLVRAEARAIPGIQLMHHDEVRSRLEGVLKAAPEGCEGNPGCSASFGRAVAAQSVLTGVAAGLSDAYAVTLKLVDVATGREVARTDEKLSGKPDDLIYAARSASYRVLAPHLYIGTLVLRVPTEGAEVSVDGRGVGRTPLPGPIGGLKPDKHALRITKTGFKDFEQFFEVRFQGTTILDVDLRTSRITGEFIEVVDVTKDAAAAPGTVAAGPTATPRLTWILGGVGGALALGAAGMGVTTYLGRTQAVACYRDGACNQPQIDAMNRQNDVFLTVAESLGVAAGAAFVAALAVDFLTRGGGGTAVSFHVVPADGGSVAVRWSF